MKKIFINLYGTFFNTVFFQKIFEKLYPKLLKLMNYGKGGDFSKSGEIEVINYVKKNIPQSNKIVVFDVGANTGGYSLVLSNLFNNREVIIFSFEPSRITFEKLIEIVEGDLKIVPLNIGLSDKEGTSNLYSDSSSSGLASVYNRRLAHFNKKLDKVEEIKLSTLDSFCSNRGIETIDFLKIDVEGHELKVLQGAKKMIENGRIRFIQFEFGGCNIDSRTFFQDFYYLLIEKYKIYRVFQNGLVPILGYNETNEIFLTVNYFAELRSFSELTREG